MPSKQRSKIQRLKISVSSVLSVALLLLLLLTSTARAADETLPPDKIVPPNANAQRMLGQLATYQPGSPLHLPPGVFDFGNGGPVFLPNNARIVGAPNYGTVLQSPFEDRAAYGANFEAGGGVTVLEGLHIKATCGPDQQSVLVGWSRKANADVGAPYAPNEATLILYRCKIDAIAWGPYIWAGGTVDGKLYGYLNRMVIIDCDITFGSWGITAGGSGSGDWQTIDVANCRLNGFADLCTYQGEKGPRLMAFCARGGRIRAWNNKIKLVGNKQTDAVRGAWTAPADRVDNGSKYASIELLNNTFEIVPNGAKHWADVENKDATITVLGGSGSLPGGKYKTVGKVYVTDASVHAALAP